MNSLGDIYEEIGVKKESTVGEIDETYKEMDIGHRKWFSEYRKILLDPIKRSYYEEIDEMERILSKARKKKRYFESINDLRKWWPEETKLTRKIESGLPSLINKTMRSIEKDEAGRTSCLLWKRFLYMLAGVGQVIGPMVHKNLPIKKNIFKCSWMFVEMRPHKVASGLNIFWDCKKLSLLVMLPYLELFYTDVLCIADICNQLIEDQHAGYKVPCDVKVTADLMRKLIFCRFAFVVTGTYGLFYHKESSRGIILPLMGYTYEERRLYEKNPVEYTEMRIGQVFRHNYGSIKCDHEVIFDFQFKFAREIRNKLQDTHDKISMCNFCLDILERPTEGNEIDKEKALHLIRAALFDRRYNTASLRNRKVVERRLFSEILPYLIMSESNFLRARACSMLNVFHSDCEFWEEVNERKLELYRSLANEPELCVKLEVIMLAISYFTFYCKSHSFIPMLFGKMNPLRCHCPEYMLKSVLERSESNRSALSFLEDIVPKLELIIEELIEESTLISKDVTE